MANIDNGADENQHKKIRGVKRAKKLNTRVDMTPMVDLGFLLITFFIFTSTMVRPKKIDLTYPKDDGIHDTPIKESGTLTIMIGKNNTVFYYEGQLAKDGTNFKVTDLRGIRKIIIAKKNEVIAHHKHDKYCEALKQKARLETKDNWEVADLDKDLVVVIKPSADATLQNTVDILDEMKINIVKTFTIDKISDVEINLLKASGG